MSTTDVAAVAAETPTFAPVIHGAEDTLAEAVAAFADLQAAESSAADATARIGAAFVRAMRSGTGIALRVGKAARPVSLRTFAEATGIPKATIARGSRLAALRESIPTVAWPVRAADALASSMLEDFRLTPDAAASLAEAAAKHPTDPMAAITAAKGGNPASQSGGNRQSAKAKATARKAMAAGTTREAIAEEASAALRVAEAVAMEATDDQTKAEAKAAAASIRVMTRRADAEDWTLAFGRLMAEARRVMNDGDDEEGGKAMAEAVTEAAKAWRAVAAEAKAIVG